MAGRFYQMRARKSYLAAHPSSRAPEANSSFPRDSLQPETFEHAILACPFRQGARIRLLYGVRDICHEASHWTSVPLLKRLAHYIGVTSTGFPPTMFPPTTTPFSPTFPLSPPNPPPPLFLVFSLTEAKLMCSEWRFFLPVGYAGIEFVTGRGGEGFDSPGPALTMGRGGVTNRD